MRNIRFIRWKKRWPTSTSTGVNPWGKARDIEDLSNSNSTLDDLLGCSRKRNGARDETEQPAGERRFLSGRSFRIFQARCAFALYWRRHQFHREAGAFRSAKARRLHREHHYHQPSDEVDPNWDLSGAVQDVQLLFEVGYQVANGDKFPEWKPGSEFKAKRDEMLKK